MTANEIEGAPTPELEERKAALTVLVNRGDRRARWEWVDLTDEITSRRRALECLGKTPGPRA